MAWKRKKAKATPQPDSLAPIRTLRPPKGGLAAAMDEANALRPEHVPDGATLLVAWVDLPGENTQRTGHWAKNKIWKEGLQRDFGACLELQGHPGTYEKPGVHIRMDVTRKGDANNMLSRAKYVIDLLQIKKERVDGQRIQGMFDLIENDDVLTNENRTVEEHSIKVQRSEEKDKYSREKRFAPHRVTVWVWDAAG